MRLIANEIRPFKISERFPEFGQSFDKNMCKCHQTLVDLKSNETKKRKEKGNNIQQIPRRETAVSICQRSLKPRPSITRERLLENKNSATASTVN